MKSLERALQVLGCFSEDRPEWGISDLARQSGLPKSTIHDILSTLQRGGFIHHTPVSKRYRLGPKAIQLGFVGRISLRLREYALPYLEELQEKTGQIVYLTIPYEGEVLYLEAVYPSKRLIHYSVSGRTAPMHCTGVGKAILAYFSPEEVELIVRRRGLPRFTENTICALEELNADLALIRKRGYALDLGESDVNIRCAAVPIWSRDKVIASMSVSGPTVDFTEAAIGRYVELLMTASNSITNRLKALPLDALVIA